MRRHPNDPAAWLRNAEAYASDATGLYPEGGIATERLPAGMPAIYRAIAEGLAREVIDHESAS